MAMIARTRHQHDDGRITQETGDAAGGGLMPWLM
jgi:hypothetical protein